MANGDDTPVVELGLTYTPWTGVKNGFLDLLQGIVDLLLVPIKIITNPKEAGKTIGDTIANVVRPTVFLLPILILSLLLAVVVFRMMDKESGGKLSRLLREAL